MFASCYFQMNDHTTKRLYVPLLLWLIALATICNSRAVSADKGHGSPMVFDPCATKCQAAKFTCIQKCDVKGTLMTQKEIACQMECQKKFETCLNECQEKKDKSKEN